MFINELIKKRACCLVCGKKIPSIRRMSVSLFNSAECPSCKSYMTFKKSVFALQIFLFIFIFPALSLIFKKHYVFTGSLALLTLVTISVLIALTAEFKLDPATAYALKKREEVQKETKEVGDK